MDGALRCVIVLRSNFPKFVYGSLVLTISKNDQISYCNSGVAQITGCLWNGHYINVNDSAKLRSDCCFFIRLPWNKIITLLDYQNFFIWTRFTSSANKRIWRTHKNWGTSDRKDFEISVLRSSSQGKPFGFPSITVNYGDLRQYTSTIRCRGFA